MGSTIWLMAADDLSRLIRRSQEGDKDAFGEIYNLFLKRIFRFVYFSVRDRELAADLTQTTFLKAWQSIKKFSLQRGSFQAFLFTIARNLVIDHGRKKKEVSLETIADFPSFENPEEDMERLSEKRRVLQALSKLDRQDREIVVFRYFEELSFSEIARVTGKREGAVRVKVHRVLKKLKEHLEQK